MADLGQIPGIDWKNFASKVLIARSNLSFGSWTIWKAVFGQTQFTFSTSSKVSFCNDVSNAK